MDASLAGLDAGASAFMKCFLAALGLVVWCACPVAAEGVRCTAGYVTAPQCSPSRAGLLTGRYQQRISIDAIPDLLPTVADWWSLPHASVWDGQNLAPLLANPAMTTSMIRSNRPI